MQQEHGAQNEHRSQREFEQACRSVEGLSIEFQMLNLLGFLCYSAYNVALFYIPAVQREYAAQYRCRSSIHPRFACSAALAASGASSHVCPLAAAAAALFMTCRSTADVWQTSPEQCPAI